MEMKTAIVARTAAAPTLLAEYFTLQELARELRVARKTLDRWRVEGRGPARTKVGRRVCYNRKSVLRWLATCEKDPHQRDRRFGSRKRKAR